MKDFVYQTKVADTDEHEARIRNAIATVDIGMLTWQEIEYRLDILRAMKRAPVQLQKSLAKDIKLLHLIYRSMLLVHLYLHYFLIYSSLKCVTSFVDTLYIESIS